MNSSSVLVSLIGSWFFVVLGYYFGRFYGGFEVGCWFDGWSCNLVFCYVSFYYASYAVVYLISIYAWLVF
jgi:hypothetical protein